MFSSEQCVEFEWAANPHSWFLIAAELHEQAKVIKDSQAAIITMTDGGGKPLKTWKMSNRSTFLLCGFAIENLLKAFLVYEYPHYVSDGKLSPEVKTHSLTKLEEKSGLVPYKSQTVKILSYFEEGLESWARYPCGLNWAQTRPQSILTDKMWGKYIWLMSAYEKRFKKLIRKGWKGEHEFNGHFNIESDWFT